MSWFGLAVILFGLLGGVFSVIAAVSAVRAKGGASRRNSESRKHAAVEMEDASEADLPPEVGSVTVRQYLEDSDLRHRVDRHLKLPGEVRAKAPKEVQSASKSAGDPPTVTFTGPIVFAEQGAREVRSTKLYEGRDPSGGWLLLFVNDRGVLFEVRAGQGAKNWSLEETSLAELPPREEHRDEAGRVVRTIEDGSGALYSLTLDKKGIPSELLMTHPPA